MMTCDKWELFFELMQEVLDGSGTVDEKAQALKRQAELYSVDLSTFASLCEDFD